MKCKLIGNRLQVPMPSKRCSVMNQRDPEDEDDEEADVTDTEPHIQILHSLTNDRFTHMGFSIYSKVGRLRFVTLSHAPKSNFVKFIDMNSWGMLGERM